MASYIAWQEIDIQQNEQSKYEYYIYLLCVLRRSEASHRGTAPGAEATMRHSGECLRQCILA